MSRDLCDIFGCAIGNALHRNGIFDIAGLREHIAKHPHKYDDKREWWKRIGAKSYKVIDDYLNGKR